MRIVIVMVALGLVPAWGCVWGCSGSSAAEAQPSAPARTMVVELAIGGMVSRNCPVLVRTAVGRVRGVSRVDASLERRNAVVTFDASQTSAEAIRRVIQDQAGFEARIVRVTPRG